MSPEPEKVLSPTSLAERPWEELKTLRVGIHEILDPALERLRIAEAADAVEIIGFLLENPTEKGLEGKQYVHPLVHFHRSRKGYDLYFALGGFGLKVASPAQVISPQESVKVVWEGYGIREEYSPFSPDDFDARSGKCFWGGQSPRVILRENLDQLIGDKSLNQHSDIMCERARALLNGLRAASGL